VRSAVIFTSIAAFLAVILLIISPLRKDLERNYSEVIPLKNWRVNSSFCSGFSNNIDLNEKNDITKYSQLQNRTGCISFKTTVVISDNFSSTAVAVFFPGIDDADETFFNGTLIGKTGRFPLSETNPDGYISAWVYPRVYILPGNIIKFNSENVIEVRVYNHSGKGGFLDLSVPLIGEYSFLSKKAKLISLERNFPRVVVISSLAVFAVYLALMVFSLSGKGIIRYFYRTFSYDIMPAVFIRRKNIEGYKRFNFPYDLAIKYTYAVFMILFLIIFMFYEIIYGDAGFYGMAVLGVKYYTHILYGGLFFLILFFRKDLLSHDNDYSKNIAVLFKIMNFVTSPLFFLLYLIFVFSGSTESYFTDFQKRGYWIILFFLFFLMIKFFVRLVGHFISGIRRNKKIQILKALFQIISGIACMLTLSLGNTTTPSDSNIGIIAGGIIFLCCLNFIISSDKKQLKFFRSMSNMLEKVSGNGNATIDVIKRYIEKNVSVDISRSDIAAAVGMSPEYLSRMFAASTGKTLADYVTEIRIKNASELLISTDKTVIEICFDSGFSSLRTFNRAFQKYFLMTPTLFRQKKI